MRALAQQFSELARTYNLIPIYREVLADLETPVSVFMKLCYDEPGAFLLESVEGGERVARYSILGARPLVTLINRDGANRLYRGDDAANHVEVAGVNELAPPECITPGDPLGGLRDLLGHYRVAEPIAAPRRGGAATPATAPVLPRFYGGAVGYLGYDAVRHYERLGQTPADDLRLPDAAYMLTELVAVFDHLRHRLTLLVLAEPGNDPDAACGRALALLDRAVERLQGPVPVPGRVPGNGFHQRPPLQVSSNCTAEHFEAAVARAKQYILAGDIFQVVLSQRLTTTVRAAPMDIYRVLRTVNPSPYMFYLSFGDLKLIGASPELMVRVEDGIAHTRPIAGTMPRGQTEAEDQANEQRLLADAKERAEHLMLVDLGRNDLGRVCEYGSVQVTDLMQVERYSHVMHMVSHVRGRLAAGKDCFDALAACFPAGTLSGAPKVRAMEIIDELEPTKRCSYGGAVGYFGFQGNMDTCITIRTLLLKGAQAYIQAGAGIVADSDPGREYQETLHKAGALLRTLELAEEGIQP